MFICHRSVLLLSHIISTANYNNKKLQFAGHFILIFINNFSSDYFFKKLYNLLKIYITFMATQITTHCSHILNLYMYPVYA